ncbi:MAG TPA: DUF763 domain-containing protein [Halobacteriales archaeon]|nr:DUF763 domain-containing protein [Halobacteriales archaeon]
MHRRGTATLPLHTGSAPRWLFDRMVDLGGAIAEVIVEEHGRGELLRRLADPYWFQAFGCVLGFDWHSSGLTTTTMGALKEALDPEEHGVFVAGGKGATSRKTPDEIDETPLGISGSDRAALKRDSRMSAKVDNACLQDAYTLYHHTMVVTEDGDWCVVQQGMSDSSARRYHWLSREVDDLVCEPQSAIASQAAPDSVLDLTAARAEETREVSVDLVNDDPSHLERYLQPRSQRSLADFGAADPYDAAGRIPELRMPNHHELRPSDLSERAIDQLKRAYEVQPADFEALVGVEGIGQGSLRALGLIAELVYDAESSHEDPAKYAYAHGGKDGTPNPVHRERYDRSVEFLQATLSRADVEGKAKRTALERLSKAG